MFQRLSKELRSISKKGFYATTRFVLACALALLMPLAASAYTIVLRSGRRIEVPDKFDVTQTTLTYEAAPGINVTVQMASIDIAATERVNHEPPGSLLRRAQQPQPRQEKRTGTTLPADRMQQARRTITNKDLEALQRTRLESEAAYDRRAKELGLPPLEEARRRAAEETAQAREQLRQSQDEEVQAEAYWRARASSLRSEIEAVDAEIDYLRARLSEIPDSSAIGSFTTITSIVPIAPLGHLARPLAAFGNANIIGRPNIYVGPRSIGPQISGRAVFGGGASRGQVFINPPIPTTGAFAPIPGFFGPQHFPGQRVFLPGAFLPPVTVVGSSYPYDYSSDYERGALLARLSELQAERAGLQARWRALEDEARRAGAMPGWLRP